MRVLPTVNLTGFQKILLTKIQNAPESQDGGKRIHADSDKLVSAKEFLVKLGIITLNSDTGLLSLTDKATALMQEEGLIDAAGELTEIGKQYAAGKIPKSSQPTDDETPQTEKFHISFKDYITLIEA
jgi:hypothetical protein